MSFLWPDNFVSMKSCADKELYSVLPYIVTLIMFEVSETPERFNSSEQTVVKLSINGKVKITLFGIWEGQWCVQSAAEIHHNYRSRENPVCLTLFYSHSL